MAGFENTKDHWARGFPGGRIPDGIVSQINADLHPVWTPYNEHGGLDVWVAICPVPYVGTALAGFGNTPQDAHAQLVKWAQHVGAPKPQPLEEFEGAALLDERYKDDQEEEYRNRTFDEAMAAGDNILYGNIYSGRYMLYKFATSCVWPVPGEIGWGITRRIRPGEIAPPRDWWEPYKRLRNRPD